MNGVSRFDCYPSDFLNGIIGLTADDIAVYTVIIMLQYDRGGPVRYIGYEREIFVRAGLTRKRLTISVDSLIERGKLSKTEDGKALFNERTEKELTKIAERISKNGGKVGKNSEKIPEKLEKNGGKVGKKPRNFDGFPNDIKGDDDPPRARAFLQPSPSPSTIEDSPNGESSNRARAVTAFDRFWSVWPNKVQKPYAERCFAKVASEVDAIVAGVERYIRDKPPDRQWLNPSTYLNQRRWEDQPALPIASQNGNSDAQRNGKPSLVEAAADLVEKIRLRKMRSGDGGDVGGEVIPLLPRL